MAKIAAEFLEIQPWRVVEKGFHPDRNMVSESVFSLANEYMGVRGFAEEGTSAPSLSGCYFNGIYENAKDETGLSYRGVVRRSHFMINSVNWLKTGLEADGETLRLGETPCSEFERRLDLQTGLLTRRLVYETGGGKLEVVFSRLLDRKNCRLGYQKIELKSDYPCRVRLKLGLDFAVLHWGKDCYWRMGEAEHSAPDVCGILCRTPTTGQQLASAMAIRTSGECEEYTSDMEAGKLVTLSLLPGKSQCVLRFAANLAEREAVSSAAALLGRAQEEARAAREEGFDAALERSRAYWEEFWKRSDIEILGDPANQQGIRFCIFQLHQTYHGYSPTDNIGAKGLTGEAYSGHAFWDTETYCLPYYLFNDPKAARSLLEFRYHTLPRAKERAKELDCEGACYPIATLDGREACDLWQHASLQFQPSTGVAYGIRHYVNVTQDRKFLEEYGAEMLLEISKFLLSRGQWNADGTKFGYYCVMGPDEFQMMVNHNCYTNFMAKKTFEYTLEVFRGLSAERREALAGKTGFSEETAASVERAARHMLILYDEETKLFEQHDGFFDLPHVDVRAIPITDFPLYHHWSYDRIYRNDMIKQPDVLMFLLLYNQDFSEEVIAANYDYYEPRCIHESSLSPSVHSILAAQLGRMGEAVDFFRFASRLDLDDYNRNASEGLHTTSIAAAWLNIVYGFGGLRSDRETLRLSPVLPDLWEGYSFSLLVRGSLIKVRVTRENVTLIPEEGDSAPLLLYGEPVVADGPVTVPLRP